jgi:hypothetical protein
MKIRHVVALALMGWYLIVPPTTRIWWFGPERSDNGAQLSRWTIEQSFDKAGVCEAARRATEQTSGGSAVGKGNAICVSSDDARLNLPI